MLSLHQPYSFIYIYIYNHRPSCFNICKNGYEWQTTPPLMKPANEEVYYRAVGPLFSPLFLGVWHYSNINSYYMSQPILTFFNALRRYSDSWLLGFWPTLHPECEINISIVQQFLMTNICYYQILLHKINPNSINSGRIFSNNNVFRQF